MHLRKNNIFEPFNNWYIRKNVKRFLLSKKVEEKHSTDVKKVIKFEPLIIQSISIICDQKRKEKEKGTYITILKIQKQLWHMGPQDGLHTPWCSKYIRPHQKFLHFIP